MEQEEIFTSSRCSPTQTSLERKRAANTDPLTPGTVISQPYTPGSAFGRGFASKQHRGCNRQPIKKLAISNRECSSPVNRFRSPSVEEEFDLLDDEDFEGLSEEVWGSSLNPQAPFGNNAESEPDIDLGSDLLEDEAFDEINDLILGTPKKLDDKTRTNNQHERKTQIESNQLSNEVADDIAERNANSLENRGMKVEADVELLREVKDELDLLDDQDLNGIWDLRFENTENPVANVKLEEASSVEMKPDSWLELKTQSTTETFVRQPPPETTPQLNREQQRVLDEVMAGNNVFYTGSAGCGKSTVLKAIVRKLSDMGKSVHVVAPTGMAALQVNGMTTWSFMGWSADSLQLPIENLLGRAYSKMTRRRLKTDVLIIDEISMVENQFLERMNYIMSWVRRNENHQYDRTFGGVQLIVTGDFFQLPPVQPFEFCMVCGRKMESRYRSTEFFCPKTEQHGVFPEADKWAFKSSAWEEADFVHIELKEIHRQRDMGLINILQKCRLGIPFSSQDIATLSEERPDIGEATRILCRRGCREFDDYDWYSPEGRQDNDLMVHTQRDLEDGTLRDFANHRIEPSGELREGMVVILQVNLDLRAGLCNGSQGVIFDFEDFDFSGDKLPRAIRENDRRSPYWGIRGEHAGVKARQIRRFMEQQKDRRWPRVVFKIGDSCVTRTIRASCLINLIKGRNGNELLLHRTQIPLTPGWAITVHKSQGMTLSRVIVDLSKAFEKGQVYVALSRATSLEGLRLQGSTHGLWLGAGADGDVREFYKDRFGLDVFLEQGT